MHDITSYYPKQAVEIDNEYYGGFSFSGKIHYSVIESKNGEISIPEQASVKITRLNEDFFIPNNQFVSIVNTDSFQTQDDDTDSHEANFIGFFHDVLSIGNGVIVVAVKHIYHDVTLISPVFYFSDDEGCMNPSLSDVEIKIPDVYGEIWITDFPRNLQVFSDSFVADCFGLEEYLLVNRL